MYPRRQETVNLISVGRTRRACCTCETLKKYEIVLDTFWAFLNMFLFFLNFLHMPTCFYPVRSHAVPPPCFFSGGGCLNASTNYQTRWPNHLKITSGGLWRAPGTPSGPQVRKRIEKRELWHEKICPILEQFSDFFKKWDSEISVFFRMLKKSIFH